MHLEVLHERYEVAVARKDDDGIQFGGSGNRIDCKPHVPVGLFGAACEYLEVLEPHFDADFSERLKKRFFFAGLGRNRVCASAHEAAAGERVLQDVAEINARVIDILRAVIEILRVDKDADALFWMFDDRHRTGC